MSLALSGGVVGSLDEDQAGFSNATFQLRFAAQMKQQQNLAIRIGRMDFGDEGFGSVIEATIDYLTISGEYLFEDAFGESGIYIGLGLFDQSGIFEDAVDASESGVGLVLGALGEYRLADRWYLLGEVGFAYTNLDVAQFFLDLQIGVGFRF